jgi:LCP family protein required for cell wall assembly
VSSNDDDGFGPVLKGGPRSGPVVRPRGSGRRARSDAGPAAPQPVAPRRPAHDDGYGPPARGRSLRPRRRRRGGAGRTLLITVLVLALLLLGPPLALAAYASSQVDRRPVDNLGSAPSFLQMNVLVVGSDSRDGLTEEEIREFSTGRAAGGRADSIMILSVRGTQAAMLSIPRDLYVTRCDGSEGRVNAAFGIGDGPSCLVDSVSQQTGIPVTHYLELNMGSFVRLVDAVGTVEVCIDEPMRDESAAIDLAAGCHDLDRGEALGFVRARKIDDDFGRQGRQQYFVQQLAKEIASPSTALNPLRLFETARSGGRALTADERFGTFDFIRFAIGARGIGSAPSYKVPADPQTVGGAAMLVQRDGEAEPIYASFRDGSVFRDPPEQDEDA